MSEIGSPQYPQQNPSSSPIQTLGSIAAIQNAMNQNKLFQQEYQSKLGLGQIYKDAVDPQTGQLDPSKIPGLLAGPNGAGVTLGLPQAIQNSQEAQSRNIGIDVAKVQQAQAHLQAVAGYLAPLVKPGSTSADVAAALAHATTNGLADTNMAAKIWSSLPRNQQGQIDDSQIPAWAQQQQLQVMNAGERLKALSPEPQQVDMGNAIGLIRTPQMGAPSLAGTIQKGLPPTTPVFNQQAGQMQYAGGGGGTGAGGGQGGGIGAAPPLGAPEAAATSATFQANQGNTLSARADRVMDNKATLGNLEAELGDFTSGPGTESIAHMLKLVNANVPGANFNAQGLSSREQFNKLAGMLAQSQFQALGGTGTDAKLDATTLTSPNSELSKLGNKGIISMLKGNEDAISAKNQAWQAYAQQNGPGSYASFAKQFNQKYDPRVFQAQYMNPQDQKKMLSGMTQSEKNQLFQSAQFARQNGWIK